MSATDEELAALVIAVKDRDAFGELVRRHQSLVRGMLARMTGNRAFADDLAQNAFIRAFQKVGTYRGEGSFKAWLCRIAYAEFLQARRKQAAVERTMAQLSAAQALDEAAGRGIDRGDAVDLDRALATLSADERACIVLCYACGMSHGEAAVATGLPLGTVKSHVSRGREKLRGQMMQEVAP